MRREGGWYYYLYTLGVKTPVGTLALAAFGLIEEQNAVRIALGFGVATLALQGARYAALERLGTGGTIVSVALNVSLGLVIVGLEVLLAH